MNCDKCDYYTGRICTDKTVWINKDGEEVCRYQEGAVMKELIDEVSLSHFVNVIPSFNMSPENLILYIDQVLEKHKYYNSIDRESYHYGFNAGVEFIKKLLKIGL